MTEALWIQIITTVGIVAVAWLQFGQRRELKRVARDAAATREDAAATRQDAAASRAQTENEHADAEYPNLRDELTATRELIRSQGEETSGLLDKLRDETRTKFAAVRDDIGGLHSEVRDVRQEQEDSRQDILGIRADSRKDRRRLAAQEKRLAQIPVTVQQAVHEHVTDCPLRRTGDDDQ